MSKKKGKNDEFGDFEIREVLKLNNIQYRMFLYIAKRKDSTAKELFKKFNRDRTTIQKNLTHLINVGVLDRAKVSGGQTGYRYFYNVNEKCYDLILSKVDYQIVKYNSMKEKFEVLKNGK